MGSPHKTCTGCAYDAQHLLGDVRHHVRLYRWPYTPGRGVCGLVCGPYTSPHTLLPKVCGYCASHTSACTRTVFPFFLLPKSSHPFLLSFFTILWSLKADFDEIVGLVCGSRNWSPLASRWVSFLSFLVLWIVEDRVCLWVWFWAWSLFFSLFIISGSWEECFPWFV